MQYYKTITDELYAYDDGINYQDYTDKVMISLTEAEYLAIVTPTEDEIQAQSDAEQADIASRLAVIASLDGATGLSIDTIRLAI